MRLDVKLSPTMQMATRPSRLEDDLALVRAAAARDPAASERCAQRMEFVAGLLRRKGSRQSHPLRSHDLDDLVQEVFARVWCQLPTYRGLAPFEAWVARFCDLVLIERFRRSRLVGWEPLVDDPRDRLETDLGARLDSRAVVRGLTDEEARIVRLHLLEGWTFREASRLLGLPLGTVKARYYRGLARVRANWPSLG